MCTICHQMRPWAPDCAYSGTAAASSGEGALETWSLDRIADQLLTGYWGASGPRAFDVREDRTITYDVSALPEEARATARAALAEWSAVTGLVFEEGGRWAPSVVRREAADAAASTATTARLVVGEAFEGRVDEGDDSDWIRVDFAAGQLAAIRLEGVGASGLDAPVATLRSASGRALDFQWRTEGGATEITVAAQGGPATVYVEAAGRAGAVGDYRLTLRDPAADSSPDITFGDDRAGAFASVTTRDGAITSADINVDAAWLERYGSEPGGYGFQAYLHEIGHALGLGHAGSYNGSASYPADALYANDSWQASVMSYFSPSRNTAVDADAAFVVTPMAADLLAVARAYGEVEIRGGDTVYGDNSTAGGALDLVSERRVAFTIADTDGHDAIDLTGQAAAQRVDLREAAASDVFGLRGNMVIARGTLIEDARLGRGDDDVTGNAAANRLEGGHGADTLRGLGGNDALKGNSGRDLLIGGEGNDDLRGGTGDDHLIGGDGDGSDPGRDQLRGGGGSDRLEGGGGRDLLRGNSGDDTLLGGAGDDLLVGGKGDDVLVGGAGRDVFRFDSRPFGDDRILDFGDVARERIDLRRLPDLDGFDDLAILDEDDAAVIDFGAIGSIALLGLEASDLDAGDFAL